jgi:type II secretory pathway pseudopilin PulG
MNDIERAKTCWATVAPLVGAGGCDPWGHAAGARRAGFSLLELLLIMVLMGIFATIALPRLDVGRLTVDAAARGVTMTLLGAQRVAIQEQHDVVIAFDTAQQLIRVHRDRDNDNVIDANETTSTLRLEDGIRFGRGSAPARAIGGQAVTFTGTQDGLPAVTFRRHGGATAIGGFYLTSPARDDGRAFEIERSTGRTVRFEYSNGAWRRWF